LRRAAPTDEGSVVNAQRGRGLCGYPQEQPMN
jgi:hypothetical protein